MHTIGLYLLGKKGLDVLEKLSQKHLEKILFVVVGIDRNIQYDYSAEIETLCKKNNISLYKKENTDIPQSTIQFAIGWKWMIKECKDLIVLHDSLLPKYRGFNPLVTALLNNDQEIGVSAIRANFEFDKGNIILQKSILIDYPIKINDVIEKISNLYSQIVIEIVELLEDGELIEIVQDEIKATYSLWRNEDDYSINWDQSSEQILRFVDSVGFPYNGAKTLYENRFIRILNVILIEEVEIINRCPGKFLYIQNGNPIVVCGSGMLKIIDAVYDDTGERVIFNKLRIKLV
ncbi:formyltransferase family protein [Empedobacter tilapiae]|uniref:Methionyl-tRNA formyltransferase n=1 Tax=Empedobacter tilapiae TaxID=2491114 RepID=A0A4Z1BXB3_9FLAO|nr:formyltransferase family protein [Empedobacter tilapiae]TGN27175.1 methionyl-tRNA formyltransferase [Empedobacter tilapiae]